MITTEKAKRMDTKVYQTLCGRAVPRPMPGGTRSSGSWGTTDQYHPRISQRTGSDIEDILNRAARNTVRTETQSPSYSQPHSCPTCGMPWPFSG